MTIVLNVFEDKVDVMSKDDEQNLKCLETVSTIAELQVVINKHDITEAAIFACD